MKFRWFLLLIIILISIPHLSAVDTDNWTNVTVNKVNFKIPEKFSNEKMNEETYYKHGDPYDFSIFSLINYVKLKSTYGLSSTSSSLKDMEETEIEGHPAVVLYKYNDFYNYDYLEIFFATGKKIFRIQYNSNNVTGELKEIIKSTPQSKMSEETFYNKLDNAQRDYIREDYEKNLELDLEDYYRTYNKEHNRENFFYWGSNGFGVGSSTRW